MSETITADIRDPAGTAFIVIDRRPHPWLRVVVVRYIPSPGQPELFLARLAEPDALTGLADSLLNSMADYREALSEDSPIDQELPVGGSGAGYWTVIKVDSDHRGRFLTMDGGAKIIDPEKTFGDLARELNRLAVSD